MGVLLAVDGGNSKTDLVAFRPDGSVVARLRGPGSGGGPVHVGAVVRELVARSGIDRAEIDVCVAAVAGLDFADDAPAFEGALALELPGARIRALNDAAAMLSVHDVGEHLLVVVCGAGFNAVARGPLGVAAVPALDWASGDWGGADAIGREVVRVAYRGADGRGPETSLSAAVLAATGIDDFGALAHEIRDGALTDIGALARLATREAERGDAVALALVERAVDETAALAGEVSARAWGGSGVADGTPALLVGGLFRSELFLDGVRSRLADCGYDADRFPHEAVAGVVHEACAIAGLDAAIATRVIAALAASDPNERRNA